MVQDEIVATEEQGWRQKGQKPEAKEELRSMGWIDVVYTLGPFDMFGSRAGYFK